MPKAPAGAKPLVLVVEDDAFYSNIYQTKLNQEGYEVVLARNGEEGMQEATKRHPSVILLDIIMPIKDGFTMLAELQADQKLRKIPVIMLSNLGQQSDIDRATGLGANEFLVKANISLDEMVSAVRRHVA